MYQLDANNFTMIFYEKNHSKIVSIKLVHLPYLRKQKKTATNAKSKAF